MLKSLSISIKLMIALGAMMSACGVATLVVLFSLVSLQRSDDAERSATQISRAADRTLAAAVEQQNAMRSYVATGEAESLTKYAESKTAFGQAVQSLKTSDGVDAGRFNAMTAAAAAFNQQSQALMDLARDPAQRPQAVSQLTTTARLTDVRAAVKSIDDQTQGVLTRKNAEKRTAFNSGYAALVIGGVLALLVAGAMTLWLVRALSQPIVAMTRAMDQLAAAI